MFYLHERGLRTAVIVCSLACMASMVAILSGVMFQDHGYRALFVAELPFNVVGLLATVFLVPETQYVRTVTSPGRSRSSIGPECSDKDDKERVQSIEKVSTPLPREVVQIPRKSYVQILAPCSGTTYTDKSLTHLFAGIFIHLINPAVFWILLVSGMLVCFFVVSAYILSQIFSVTPYNLNVAQNGYFWTGAFVGGVLAVVAGPLCDWTARTLAKLNKGVYEAEFRIPVNILGALFVGLGWFVFMWVVDNPTPNGYFLGSFCHGCICFGISVPSTSAGLYIL